MLNQINSFNQGQGIKIQHVIGGVVSVIVLGASVYLSNHHSIFMTEQGHYQPQQPHQPQPLQTLPATATATDIGKKQQGKSNKTKRRKP